MRMRALKKDMTSGNSDGAEREKPKGMKAFSIVWIGQVVSVLGSAMTQFALIYWAWLETGEVTALALMGFFTMAPLMIMMPIAGALVDRWNKKLAIIMSDLAAGMGSVIILFLLQGDMLEIWHLYTIGAFVGIFGAFQFPAYSAAITMMVDKKHYARASGMVGMVGSIAGIFGPPLAAVMLVTIGFPSILMIDILTFTFGIGMVLLVRIPNPPPAGDLQKGVRGVLKDFPYGFKYIYRRKPLFYLQMTFFMFNLVSVFGMVVFVPMILARTDSNAIILASVQMVMAVGAVAGGLLLIAWGGPRRKINGLLGGMIIIALIFAVGFGIGRTPIIWMLTGFMAMLLIPTLAGSSQAIWQSKVPANKQGRVFAARGVIAQGASAFAMVLVGPIADWYFEPAMALRGSLAPTFGWLVGTGPGAGMALMILISGILSAIVAVIGYNIKIIRNVERLIPDADPKSQLQRYKKKLNNEYIEGLLTKEQCQALTEERKAELGL